MTSNPDRVQVPQNVLAIDPSIIETGWAVGGHDGIVASGVIRPPQGKPDTVRLTYLSRELKAVLGSKDHPLIDHVIIEVLEGFTYSRSANQYGKGKNQKCLMTQSRAIGVIIFTCAWWGFTVEEISAKWKGITDKKQAQSYMRTANHNEADARLLLQWWYAGKASLPLPKSKSQLKRIVAQRGSRI